MRYHNITKDDMLNGEGLRTVLWVAGCSHNCPQCHNPVTWDINGGLAFDEAAKEELFEELKKDYISGVTFSGGDPLHEKTGKRSENWQKTYGKNFQIKLFGCIPVMNGRRSVVFHFFPILM